MTPAELKAAIREAGLHPSQLFTLRELTADPVIEEQMREQSPANHEFARIRRELTDAERRAKEFEDRATKAESDVKVHQKKAEDLSKTNLRTAAKDHLAGILKERKLVDGAGKPVDEKLIKFINKNFEKSFVPTDEAAIKGDLNRFLDGLVDDFKEFAPVPSQTGGQAAAAGEESAAGGEIDLTDSKNNPLIPQ